LGQNWAQRVQLAIMVCLLGGRAGSCATLSPGAQNGPADLWVKGSQVLSARPHTEASSHLISGVSGPPRGRRDQQKIVVVGLAASPD
jgi:hypothetical protein